MSYKVGQVLFVVLRKEAKVYPMQVVEEITKKTLEGEVKTYMVRAGAKSEDVLSVSDIDGEIFDSATKAKSTLIERSTSVVTQRIEMAVAKAKEWYPSGFEEASDDPLTAVRKANITSISKPKTLPKKQVSSELAELQAEMQAEAAAIDEDATFITLPDGTKAKVNSVKLPESMQR